MYGYTGKILRLDLTNGKAIVMNTRDYEQWVGGHGMGASSTCDAAECGDAVPANDLRTSLHCHHRPDRECAP